MWCVCGVCGVCVVCVWCVSVVCVYVCVYVCVCVCVCEHVVNILQSFFFFAHIFVVDSLVVV